MTAALVKGIIDRRPFLTMKDLNALLSQSLNATQLSEVYRRLFVQIDLNTATNEEVLLIPGLGKRMLGEFLEYRPYKALSQFRREIGKYVSDAEVKRLERYVTLN